MKTVQFSVILGFLAIANAMPAPQPLEGNVDSAKALNCHVKADGLLCHDPEFTVERRDVGENTLSKRCIHNGGGWYWCSFHSKPEDESTPERRDIGENTLSKRCFHNGGGWYWCSFHSEPEDDSTPEHRDIGENTLSKRCFHNGGGWYWCSFHSEPEDETS